MFNNIKTPKGFEKIREYLTKIEEEMNKIICEPSENINFNESLWPIMKLNHKKSKFVYLLYKRKKISKKVYKYCLKNRYADRNLIEMWKRQGYENLCCLQCIQRIDTNFDRTCICRVPSKEVSQQVECNNCGCSGCSGH